MIALLTPILILLRCWNTPFKVCRLVVKMIDILDGSNLAILSLNRRLHAISMLVTANSLSGRIVFAERDSKQ